MSKISKTTFFTKFNNIVSSEYDYDVLYNYLEFKQYPPHVETVQQKEVYKERYKYFSISKTRNKIITFKYQDLVLEVIPASRVQDVIDHEYHHKDDLGLGKGIVAFYKMIQTKYIGITRKDVNEYLTHNAEYNMNSTKKHKINKPIIAKNPNDLWCIDLIDMGVELAPINNNYRYIMTVVDVFSRYTYIEALKDKTSILCANTLSIIITRNDVQPKAILTDNGGEFKKDFEDYLIEHNIAHRETRTYSPQANGIVERANKEIRKIIRAVMIRYNTNQWKLKIRKIESIKNSNYHSTIKTTPETIHNYEPTDTNDDFLNQTYETVIEGAKSRLAKYKESDFEIGESVIVSMAIPYSDFRRKLKSGLKKEIVVFYEPIVYTINSIIYPKTSLERKRYTLRVKDTNTFLRSANSNEYTRVYGSDLKHCEVDEFDMTTDEALNLNGCKRLTTDLKVF